MKKLIGLLLLFTLSNISRAEFINIGIFYGQSISAVEFSIRAGSYTLYSELGKITSLTNKDQVQVKSTSNGIEITIGPKKIGPFQKVDFVGTGWYNHFMVKPLGKNAKSHRYDDNLKIISQNANRMQLINNLDLDNYVAGVVEAEVGQKPAKEYFKLQAIICRTYALSNTHKHLLEGFNLCDQVHCQAYHGKSFFAPIVEASMQTRGAVIVDNEIQLITAAFHSNCGGQTVNSEDVWSKSLYYLRSVEDTFCTNLKNSFWEKRVARNKWDQITSAQFKADDEDSIALFYSLEERQKYYPPNTDWVSTETLRDEFRLRSTYFDVINHGDTILLCGRGYGHGVGLCQIGAMEMAKRGYNYSQILHYYYQGVHIIDLSALDFFKSD